MGLLVAFFSLWYYCVADVPTEGFSVGLLRVSSSVWRGLRLEMHFTRGIAR